MADHLKMLLSDIDNDEQKIRKENAVSYKRLYIGVGVYYLIGTLFYAQTIRIATALGATDMSYYGPKQNYQISLFQNDEVTHIEPELEPQAKFLDSNEEQIYAEAEKLDE